MEIRRLKEEEFEQAFKIKADYWTGEFQLFPKDYFNVLEESKEVINWVREQEKYQDCRLVYGAFDNDELVGFIGSSIAETSDSESGIEINYLFVKKAYRKKGYSLKLMRKILNEMKDFHQVIVYNYSVAPSNQFYRYLKGKVLRTDKQGELDVDIFVYDYQELKGLIHSMIEQKYPDKCYELNNCPFNGTKHEGANCPPYQLGINCCDYDWVSFYQKMPDCPEKLDWKDVMLKNCPECILYQKENKKIDKILNGLNQS